MEKHEKMAKWEDNAIEQFLQKAAEAEQIPDSLHPKQMEGWLKEAVAKKGQPQQQDTAGTTAGKQERQEKGTVEATGLDQGHTQQDMAETPDAKQRRKPVCRKWWYGTAVAACLAVVLFVAGRSMDWNIGLRDTEDGAAEDMQDASASDDAALEENRIYSDVFLDDAADSAEDNALDDAADSAEDNALDDTADVALGDPGQSASGLKEGATYKEVYQAFCNVWKEQDGQGFYSASKGDSEGSAEYEMSSVPQGIVPDGEEQGVDAVRPMAEGAEEKSDPVGQAEENSQDYGKTNQQEEEIEEADIIKNDGRYIYHVASTDFSLSKEAVQITDTKDGLQKAAAIEGFDEGEIKEMYVWKDTLVVVETGWASSPNGNTAEGDSQEDVAYEMAVPFSRIHIYGIQDRTKPEKYHEFTIKGDYKDSRISDGYLYFFAGYTAYRPQMETDYRAYIPEVDNEPLAADKIYLPEEMEDTSYLVMASINMEKPDAFTDTKAIVASAESFYVSKGNIYMANSSYIDYSEKGLQTDSTNIYRFSYQDGNMKKEAEGRVKGTLRDHFAMNEYKGYLRMVTTLNEENLDEVKDDVTGESIGYMSKDTSTSNSLYVLDPALTVVGKIEDIAEGEQVYSARFLGDAGYFVTFRQTDPLFSVDLSDPRNPNILGELKISGFSEYLHFYGENQLLGIGMEADESTGATEGLKITMFDISDPSDVGEESTVELGDYDYASALYDYKAVLIDPQKNLFGFCAEKRFWEDVPYQYLLFSYEDGEFRKRLEIDCGEADIMDDSDSIRGTYIGDVFYLTYYSGRVGELASSGMEGGGMEELLPSELP